VLFAAATAAREGSNVTDNWVSLGVQAAVAAGTLVLAFFTWQLARSTNRSVGEAREERMVSIRIADSADQELRLSREQVVASQDQAQATREALTASIQPLLTSVPLQQYLSNDELLVEFAEGLVEPIRDLGVILVPRYRGREGEFCSVPLRNIGSVVALVRSNSV
jgi:hypothetical protein